MFHVMNSVNAIRINGLCVQSRGRHGDRHDSTVAVDDITSITQIPSSSQPCIPYAHTLNACMLTP